MRVNVAIIAHDNPKVMLDASIGSVLLEKSEIHQLFLVDNSSTDRLRKHYDALTTYIYPGKNLGFGAANNIAMRRSIDESVDYHLLVNPDIYFNQGTIRELLDFMDAHPDVGLVSPKVVYPNGTTQHLCKLIPTPADLIGRRFLGW
ncbi:MAG TPA: glycosyltransferase, partial [Epsilonproteobacteria bacterium]|nr:glycosyltransferase [Campylobacterota bacterium]